MISKGLHITPFNYYLEIFVEMLKTDKSYDSLPNFTAVDGLLLLGIGRNEYIDLMNQCRSKVNLSVVMCLLLFAVRLFLSFLLECVEL